MRVGSHHVSTLSTRVLIDETEHEDECRMSGLLDQNREQTLTYRRAQVLTGWAQVKAGCLDRYPLDRYLSAVLDARFQVKTATTW
jgi:hypothetical protein